MVAIDEGCGNSSLRRSAFAAGESWIRGIRTTLVRACDKHRLQVAPAGSCLPYFPRPHLPPLRAWRLPADPSTHRSLPP
jgi:hypothetical protein